MSLLVGDFDLMERINKYFIVMIQINKSLLVGDFDLMERVIILLNNLIYNIKSLLVGDFDLMERLPSNIPKSCSCSGPC